MTVKYDILLGSLRCSGQIEGVGNPAENGSETNLIVSAPFELSTNPAAIPGLSFGVMAGVQYRFELLVMASCMAVAGASANFQLSFPGSVDGRAFSTRHEHLFSPDGASDFFVDSVLNRPANNAELIISLESSGSNAGGTCWGTFMSGVSGSLQVLGSLNLEGITASVSQGSYLELRKIS